MTEEATTCAEGEGSALAHHRHLSVAVSTLPLATLDACGIRQKSTFSQAVIFKQHPTSQKWFSVILVVLLTLFEWCHQAIMCVTKAVCSGALLKSAYHFGSSKSEW